MLHVIERERLLDREFISTNVLGFEELSSQVLPDCSPEQMAEICGLSAVVIERMAREYARARAPFIRLGSGLTRYGNGAMTVRTISCLPAAVGAWGKPGGGIFIGSSTGGAFPIQSVTREDLMVGEPRLISMNQLGGALTELSDPAVMSLYVYHSNPAAIAPDQNAVIRGLEREDLFTVVHERFLTDTARYADIVLPATSSLEHSDLYRCYGSYHAQRCSAVIRPVGKAKSNWEVFSLLAAEMGLNESFFRLTADELVELLLGGESRWRSAAVTKQLRQGEPIILTPLSEPKQQWLTTSGKIEILNGREIEPLPCYLPTHAVGDGYPLRLQPATTPFALNSSFYEQDDLRSKQSCMELLMNRIDAESRSLTDGQTVVVCNDLGMVRFTLLISERVPAGTVVTEGVWWREFVPGDRGVNALTSQRLTDGGRGSTLYDVTVEVKGM
jgi:anaerobic selenocysteine-containing dehydrogenase